MDYYTMKKTYSCRRCNEEIYFDSSMKSQSGKAIPLDPITKLPHDCSKSPFKTRKKSVADEIMDLDQRENERVKRIKYD
jgi:hypothetical protein